MTETTDASAIPEEVLKLDLKEGAALLEIDASLYPLDALYGAAYVLIDRAYVFLDRPKEGAYRATLAPKKGEADEATLRALAGEMANELLACAYRHRITQDNRAAIEAVTMQAIAGAMGPPSLDDLEDFDFSDEAFEDPLGIALAWEEKYKKKDPAEGDSDKSTPSGENSTKGPSEEEE